MAADFQGRWRGRVAGRNAGFSQRVLITGASSGNGAYNGVAGNSFEFTGGQFDLQRNDEAGSGWQLSAIGEPTTIYFKLDVSSAPPSKPDVGFVAQRDAFDPQYEAPSRVVRKAIFISRRSFDPASKELACEVHEGRPRLRFSSIVLDLKAADDAAKDLIQCLEKGTAGAGRAAYAHDMISGWWQSYAPSAAECRQRGSTVVREPPRELETGKDIDLWGLQNVPDAYCGSRVTAPAAATGRPGRRGRRLGRLRARRPRGRAVRYRANIGHFAAVKAFQNGGDKRSRFDRSWPNRAHVLDVIDWRGLMATDYGRAGTPRSTRTLRLTFHFAGERVELVSTRSVRMVPPPSLGAPPEAGTHGGYWAEVRDSRDRRLFHQILHDPFRTHVEVHDPDGRIRLATGPPGEGEFEVLVPDVPTARSVVLFASPWREEGSLDVASEIARFDLSDYPERQDER